MKNCSCGKPSLANKAQCRDCCNKAKRDRYALNEATREHEKLRGVQRHSSGAAKRTYAYHRFKAFEILGGQKCKVCGFADPRALQIDHVDNNGSVSRKAGLAYYREIIKNDGHGFQVLCANCNWIKKAEFEGRSLSDYPSVCPSLPKKGRKAKVTPDSTYQAFFTEEPLMLVAKRLGVSRNTLAAWWIHKFGLASHLKRGLTIQAKAAANTGRNNKRRDEP